MLLEVCVDSLNSARAAIRGGADRLELCSALALGGLTPYTALLKQIRAESNIPIRCLMRPRAGDFLYTPEEIDLMAAQIQELKDAGADGFVIGCLTPEGNLDKNAMEPLIKAADGSGLTLHRCIDVSRNPLQTYLDAKELGIDTVLTSGAASAAISGLNNLRLMLELRDEQGGPEVLIGAGINSLAILAIRTHCPSAKAFHMSGKKIVESAMIFRRADIPMGIPGLDEWHIQQTDEKAIQEAVSALCVHM
ncbi:MAG: copper homeostasis protein CutC [Oscillospiraceae bacterium]|nr:copper homeostasis protein CutC [Oscillospiraceae bacterium]